MNAALGGIAKAESVVDHNNTKSTLIRSEREKTPQTRKRNREELKIRAKASDQATPRIMWSHAAPAVTAKKMKSVRASQKNRNIACLLSPLAAKGNLG